MANIILYAHPARIETLDYGDLIGVERGLMWSVDGTEGARQAYGFEEGDFASLLEAKRAILATNPNVGIELRVGPPVVRRHDMNPHGLI